MKGGSLLQHGLSSSQLWGKHSQHNPIRSAEALLLCHDPLGDPESVSRGDCFFKDVDSLEGLKPAHTTGISHLQ